MFYMHSTDSGRLILFQGCEAFLKIFYYRQINKIPTRNKKLRSKNEINHSPCFLSKQIIPLMSNYRLYKYLLNYAMPLLRARQILSCLNKVNYFTLYLFD